VSFNVQLIDDQQGKIRLLSKDIKKLKTDKQTAAFTEFLPQEAALGILSQ
jgi:ABC-type lipopolysaccharide export system ATPase subunit